MLDRTTLNALLLEAFSGQTTWLEASRRYALEDFVASFQSTRERMQHTIADISDAEAAYASPAHTIWSLSETVTHLVYSEGFYYNKLLEITTTQLPHMAEAARGFGEGARPNVSAATLRAQLAEATLQILPALDATRERHDPQRVEHSPFFGMCTYQTWVLLLLAHEVDHVKQAIFMRRLARTESHA